MYLSYRCSVCLERALHEVKPVLPPEYFTINAVAGRTEYARHNGGLGVGLISVQHRLAARLRQSFDRQAALGQQFSQRLRAGNVALLHSHGGKHRAAQTHGSLGTVVQIHRHDQFARIVRAHRKIAGLHNQRDVQSIAKSGQLKKTVG